MALKVTINATDISPVRAVGRNLGERARLHGAHPHRLGQNVFPKVVGGISSGVRDQSLDEKLGVETVHTQVDFADTVLSVRLRLFGLLHEVVDGAVGAELDYSE